MSSFNGQVGPLIVSDGLVGCWDAASKHSYPGSGTTWKDISGQGNDATASGGPIFVNQYGGYWNFNGSDEYFTYDLQNLKQFSENTPPPTVNGIKILNENCLIRSKINLFSSIDNESILIKISSSANCAS